MSRPLRVEYAGALYHVTSRGDRREDIYTSDADRHEWLELLGKVCKRFNWRCHAWCQMDNHYHIVAETAEGNLSKGMRQLNGVYTQSHNRRHKLYGHVFQGRYKAILVDRDAYLLELSRYVVLNPVRAKMVNDAADWEWSSFHAMVGDVEPPKWLEVDWLLACFGDYRQIAVAKYRDFVRAGIGLPPLWDNLRNQTFLGDRAFIDSIQSKMKSNKGDSGLNEVSRLQRRAMSKPLTWYQESGQPRQTAMASAYLSGDYTMKEIAAGFGVHYSTVSRAVKIFESE